METRRVRRRDSFGALIVGLILLAVGGWYFFRNTLGFSLPELDSEVVWPIIVIAIGTVFVVRGFGDRYAGPDEPGT